MPVNQASLLHSSWRLAFEWHEVGLVLGLVCTIGDFWKYFNNLPAPKNHARYTWFQEQSCPDPYHYTNISGGRWVLTGLTETMTLNVLLLIIGRSLIDVTGVVIYPKGRVEVWTSLYTPIIGITLERDIKPELRPVYYPHSSHLSH